MSGESTRRGGIEFEYKTRDDLIGEGYYTIRAAGSRGAVDIAAFKPGQTLFVGCKRSGECSTLDWDRLFEQATALGAVPVLAVNGHRGRGVDYWRLTGWRVPRAPMGRQPAERFFTDEVAGPGVLQDWTDAVRQEWVSVDAPSDFPATARRPSRCPDDEIVHPGAPW